MEKAIKIKPVRIMRLTFRSKVSKLLYTNTISCIRGHNEYLQDILTLLRDKLQLAFNSVDNSKSISLL